jgi:hypothetical protein
MSTWTALPTGVDVAVLIMVAKQVPVMGTR